MRALAKKEQAEKARAEEERTAKALAEKQAEKVRAEEERTVKALTEKEQAEKAWADREKAQAEEERAARALAEKEQAEKTQADREHAAKALAEKEKAANRDHSEQEVTPVDHAAASGNIVDKNIDLDNASEASTTIAVKTGITLRIKNPL